MSYKVAITSSTGKFIDEHFGHSKNFYIIKIEEKTGKWEKIEIREADEDASAKAIASEYQSGTCNGHNDAHLNYVADLLSDCDYLLTEKIGQRSYKVLQQKGINSLESPFDLKIAIDKLNTYYLKNKKGV